MVKRNLMQTTARLVRAFLRSEPNKLKLKQLVREIVDKKAAKNVATFNNECIKELKILWKNKLTTSSEEKA
jgi:hypothetical protein